jgi:Oxysterol-binding protein
MEQGLWDEANAEKVRLEEKQRAVRRQRELEAEQAAAEGTTPEPYQPIWFNKVTDDQNGGKLIHVYSGGYWQAKNAQDWSECPDIF